MVTIRGIGLSSVEQAARLSLGVNQLRSDAERAAQIGMGVNRLRSDAERIARSLGRHEVSHTLPRVTSEIENTEAQLQTERESYHLDKESDRAQIERLEATVAKLKSGESETQCGAWLLD